MVCLPSGSWPLQVVLPSSGAPSLSTRMVAPSGYDSMTVRPLVRVAPARAGGGGGGAVTVGLGVVPAGGVVAGGAVVVVGAPPAFCDRSDEIHCSTSALSAALGSSLR